MLLQLGGNLDFQDFLQISFITSTTGMVEMVGRFKHFFVLVSRPMKDIKVSIKLQQIFSVT